jgi:predicted small secreted protein
MPKFVLMILALVALSACNTIQGAGQDVSAAGDAMSDEAADAQQGM